MAASKPIHFTGDPEADAFLGESPLALMIGFVLDQQVTVQKAFSSPLVLSQRLGGLDAAEIAAMDPTQLEAVFREKPALHRFPANMARRTQEFCAAIASEYDGDAAAVWEGARDGADLEQRLLALPGIGEMKARTMIGVIAKRLGVRPPGLGGVRAAAREPRRRRLPAGSRRLSGGQARPQGRVSSSPADRLSAMPIELRTLTDGGQTPTEIARELATFLGGAQHEPRHRGLRRPLRDGRRRPRARDAPRRAAARNRDSHRLQRRPPRPDPRAAAAVDASRRNRGLAGPDAGDRRHPRSDAPQVRRPRRRRRVVGLDELDGRLVEPAGERDRPRARRPGARARVHAQPRRALGAGPRRAHGPRRAATRHRRRRHRGARMVHPGVRRCALAPGREVPRAGAQADPDRIARPHLRPDPRARSSRSSTSTAATSPA